jgi:hypothetical protein
MTGNPENVDVPENICTMMEPEEIDNMRNFTGWALGTIQLLNKNGNIVETRDTVWIELLNGEGRARTFLGVKFIYENKVGAVSEGYAYESMRLALENKPAWFVTEIEHPSDVDNIGELMYDD